MSDPSLSIFKQQGTTPACSCVDCTSSCPKPPPLEPTPEKFQLKGFDGNVVVIFAVFLLGSSTFVFCSYCYTGKIEKSIANCEPMNKIGKRLASTEFSSSGDIYRDFSSDRTEGKEKSFSKFWQC